MTMNSTNKNLVQVFCGVRGYEEDGVAYLHIEDSARGLGFTEQKDGVEYVMWRRVDSHLKSLGFGTSAENASAHDYYIPENIFYRLCMKARNEVAEAFQAKVADEVIPSIRKTGSYSVNQTQQQSMMCLPHDYESALEVEFELFTFWKQFEPNFTCIRYDTRGYEYEYRRSENDIAQ